MADFNIPGVGESKYQTEKMIDKLVEVETKKLDSLNQRRDLYQKHQQAWQKISSLTQQLERNTYGLYSIDSPFREKSILGAPPELLSAEVNRSADIGEHKLIVESLAQAQQFQSAPLAASTQVPAGRYSFQVGEQTFAVDFGGGGVADLSATINQDSQKLLTTTLIDQGNGQSRLLFSSLQPGAEQQISFPGETAKLATDLGLISQRSSLAIVFEPQSVENGSVSNDQLTVLPGQRVTIRLAAPYTLFPGAQFIYSAALTPQQQESSDAEHLFGLRQSYGVTPPSVSYDDITLFSLGDEEALKRLSLPQIDFPAADPEKSSAPNGSIALVDSQGHLYPIAEIDQDQTNLQVNLDGLLPTSQPIVAVVIENSAAGQSATFSDLQINYGNQSDGSAINYPLQSASNAKVNYNGVDLERPTNTINDLIPGVELELKKTAPQREINLSVTPNFAGIRDQVAQLIYSYNNLMTEINIVSSRNQDVVDEKINFSTEERQLASQRLGVLQGNFEINRFRDQIRRASSVTYQTSTGSIPLAQIGISTNASGTSEGIDPRKLRGYLEMDTEVFLKTLEQNWQLVKEVFGFDSDQDRVIDQGFAYQLRQTAYSYIRANGTIRTRINSLDGNIKTTEREINDYRDYLDEYRRKLRQKYALMEGSLQELEALQETLKNFSPQQG